MSKVCHPPPGLFDFDSPALNWEPGTYGKTTFKQVYILSERFPDFLRGERERGRSDFYIKTSQGKQNNCEGSGGDKGNVPDNDQECSESAVHFTDWQQCLPCMVCNVLCKKGPSREQFAGGTLINLIGLICQYWQHAKAEGCADFAKLALHRDFLQDVKRPEKGFMHCECGPQDNRDKQPAVQAKQAGSRVKRSELGLSVRVGCPVHFCYKKVPTAPSITEIRYYAFQHLNHGPGTEVRSDLI